MINDDLFKLYDSDLLLRLRNAKNLSDTRKTLARFKDYLGEFPPSPELAKSFLAQFVDRKPRTLYRYAQMIKMFMKWYGEPLSDFKVRIPKSLPPYTEDSDIERLFKAIENKKTHKKNIVRDTLLIELALKSGMRRGELANLKVSDIHDDFLVVKEGKNGKDRIIPLSQPIVLRLKSFIKGKKPSSSVFDLKPPTITMKIKAFARKAGLENVHAHTLRHKFATNLLEQGANIRSVQHLLGHENLSTTQVYLDITDKSIREAINLLEKNNNIIDDRENKSIFQDKTNQPLLMIRAVDKPDEIDQTKVMIGGYFSHFEIWNEGQRSASEIVILLMGSDRKNWLESKQIDVIRPNESISFMPNLRARPEGNYYILCQYKHISHRANEANLNQTWLPFKVKYASKINEVYVKPNEMELKPNVSIENIIFI